MTTGLRMIRLSQLSQSHIQSVIQSMALGTQHTHELGQLFDPNQIKSPPRQRRSHPPTLAEHPFDNPVKLPEI